MALINCRECGARISDSANNCPSCGNPNIKEEKNGCSRTGFIAISVIILILFIIGTCNNESNNSSNETKPNTIDNSTESSNGIRVNKLSATERKENIEKLRNMFLDSGMDVEVTVYGKNNEILELKNIVFDDVWFRKFETEGLFENFKNLGFKQIILNNKYDYRKSVSY